MQFTVSKAPLAAALARCAAIVDAKPSIRILANCLLTVTPAAVKVFATDLEVGYETAVEIRDTDFSECAFVTCINAKKLSECVKAVPDADVHVSIDAGQHTLTLSGGTVSFTLAGLDADEYPTKPEINGDELIIPASCLHEALAPVTYCQSKNAEKSNLQGVWFKLEENDDGEVFIVTAATDGHRLCLNTLPITVSEDDEETIPALEYSAELAKGVTIPSKAVTEILHLATTGPAAVTISNNSLLVMVADERLTLRLLEGDFPDVNRVIPQNQTSRIIVKRQALIDAVTRVKIATDKENMRGIDLEINEDQTGIVLTAALPMQGLEARDRVTAEIIGVIEPMRISSEYLLQALANIGTASVELLFKDPRAPLLVIPTGTDFPQAVVMPMRGK